MVTSEDRFKQAVSGTLAKRAANRCSNPDCGAITSVPSEDRAGSVNVGEAAHIYGAHIGSARFRETMNSAERSDITNAIWLCGNCHKLVDNDAAKYPAGLLFECQREHERRVSEQVGKAGAELRQRYERRHLQEFGKLSYVAERIITEKGDHWEYKSTGEVLRFEMAPILRRWNALRRVLYMKANNTVPKRETLDWLSARFHESQQISHALSELLNVEFAVRGESQECRVTTSPLSRPVDCLQRYAAARWHGRKQSGFLRSTTFLKSATISLLDLLI